MGCSEVGFLHKEVDAGVGSDVVDVARLGVFVLALGTQVVAVHGLGETVVSLLEICFTYHSESCFSLEG